MPDSRRTLYARRERVHDPHANRTRIVLRSRSMASLRNREHNARDCDTCGAPPEPGLAACQYCKSAYANVPIGVSCPKCRAVNMAGQTQCAACTLSLTKPCLFCNSVSPLDSPTCVRCREPFAGARERIAARESEKRRQEYLKMANKGMNTVADVAQSNAGQQLITGLFSILTK